MAIVTETFSAIDTTSYILKLLDMLNKDKVFYPTGNYSNKEYTDEWLFIEMSHKAGRHVLCALKPGYVNELVPLYAKMYVHTSSEDWSTGVGIKNTSCFKSCSAKIKAFNLDLTLNMGWTVHKTHRVTND